MPAEAETDRVFLATNGIQKKETSTFLAVIKLHVSGNVLLLCLLIIGTFNYSSLGSAALQSYAGTFLCLYFLKKHNCQFILKALN